MINFSLPEKPSPFTISLANDLEHIIMGKEITIKITEDVKKPFRLILSSSSDSTEKIIFRIIEYKTCKELKHNPLKKNNRELIISNITSTIGNIVVNWFIKLFPITANTTNEVVSITNSDDFIFIRVNRYQIQSKEDVILQDIGFHLTLKTETIKTKEDKIKINFKDKKRILTES